MGLTRRFFEPSFSFDDCSPDIVILSFIGDDVNRTEFSYYPYGRRSKPYFELTNGSLVLRNVPVPQTQPRRRFQGLRRFLGYSFLANAVFSRTAERWWQDLPTARIHDNGDDVSVALMVRLDSLAKQRGAQFVAVAMATNAVIGGDARLPNVVKLARAKGIQVLDLSTEPLPGQAQRLFRSGGHYSPVMNIWIGDHIAEFLDQEGMAKRRN
jgi:hypothetical protein